MLGVIAEYEEAIWKEEGKRQRTPEDQLDSGSATVLGKHHRRISEMTDHTNAFISPVYGWQCLLRVLRKASETSIPTAAFYVSPKIEFDRSNPGPKMIL